MNKKQTVTVGISTRNGGESLFKTARSILKAMKTSKFRFIIIADSLEKEILAKLKKLGIEVIENKKSRTLASKYKQILSKCDSDIIVLTQDDLRFSHDVIPQIVSTFVSYPKVTMVCTQVKALEGKTVFERIIQVGTRGTYSLGLLWNGGDNYLLVNGRCIGMRADFIRKFTIPKNIVNLDAYFYFENKKLGGQFRYLPDAIVYNRIPASIFEHMNQSSRFQNSYQEMNKYLKIDYQKEYVIPLTVKFKALTYEFFKDPFYTFLYLIVFVYTRIKKQTARVAINPLWKEDLSTKNL